MQKVILKKGKEKSVLQRHPWVFSGAIASARVSDGEIAPLYTHAGSFAAWGYYNSRSDIAFRILAFEDIKPDSDLIAQRIMHAYRVREHSMALHAVNAYRVVHSEGDFLPGLIVDWYNGHCVIQIMTLGMDRLRGAIAHSIGELLKPMSIYERSDHEGRKREGVPLIRVQVCGDTPDVVCIEEQGIKYFVDVKKGQKTGFFCDQRDNRQIIARAARGREVLNLFSYSGGFSVAALSGGALSAVSVDSSREALSLAEKNCRLNNVHEKHETIRADVFDYVNHEDITQNCIICDPPALAKNTSSVKNALRGYKELNLKIFRKAPPQSILLTCSCSRFIDMKLFQQVVFSAANDAVRDVRIIGKYAHPSDHPVSIYCPETEYLKALLLYIS